jgi:histidine triad (HIT) family protein
MTRPAIERDDSPNHYATGAERGRPTMSYDDTNIFAKILRGEIPSQRVYEDDDVIAFMDVMPQANGHTLVVPKAPSRNIFDAEPDVLAKTISVVQKLAVATKEAFDADGVTIMQFNEAPAGQSVFHLHFHVIPRQAGIMLKPHTGEMEKPEILAANAEKIRAALARGVQR